MTFEEKNQIVILKDTTYDDIFAIVEFMYRGEINVGQVMQKIPYLIKSRSKRLTFWIDHPLKRPSSQIDRLWKK